jgi:hypothetical protein
MAAVGDRWAEGSLDTEEGVCDLLGEESMLLCFRCFESEGSETSQPSTEVNSPNRNLYKSLDLEEGVKVMDWVQELKKVEETLEEEIEAFSLRESRCRRRECTLVTPTDSPLMRRRAVTSLYLA